MFIKIYPIALTVFLFMDGLWLGLIARNFYKNQIGFIIKPDINWTAGILFYLIFIFGMTIFVISPAVERRSCNYALALGGLFGLVTYATYDLTNLATLKNWPLIVTVIDLAWGVTLSAIVSVATYFIVNKV